MVLLLVTHRLTASSRIARAGLLCRRWAMARRWRRCARFRALEGVARGSLNASAAFEGKSCVAVEGKSCVARSTAGVADVDLGEPAVGQIHLARGGAVAIEGERPLVVLRRLAGVA